MLVLSRKENERIMIGADIEIVVVDIGKGKVRIGIIAPRTTVVDRAELRAKKENDRRNGEFDTIPQ